MSLIIIIIYDVLNYCVLNSYAAILLSSYALTVGFHNLNLRIFNLRVSNPNKLIVDVFV